MLAASIAPSAAPAPTRVWISSMKTMMSPRVRISLVTILQALLEVTAVAGTGDERAEVERVELLVLQRLGNIALDDRLGQTFDDGGLADAGLADQDGVVLGTAGEDLHDPLRLLLAPDDRVELVVARGLGEVATELVEHRGTTLGTGRRVVGLRADGCRLAGQGLRSAAG